MRSRMLDMQLAVLQKLQDRLLRTIEDRVTDPAMRAIPGGSTGLLLRRETRVFDGESVRTEVSYELDVPTIRKLLSTNERARVLTEAVNPSVIRSGLVQ